MQFRNHGQHKSANELGKLSIMIVNAFSEGVDNIPATEYVLEEVVGYHLLFFIGSHSADASSPVAT